MIASDACFLSVAEAASLIAAKRLSPVELVQAYLARIERLDGTLHAYVRVLHEQALAAARTAEAEIAADRYRGPLHGIPIGLKASTTRQGWRPRAAQNCVSGASRPRMRQPPGS
jgi:aspartyl-tRNA(Asn)/glutamyl-tRNA(Gln) amidotransferase subunit A